MTDTREMRVERAKLIADCRAILDKADEEKRSTNAEEHGQWKKIWDKAEELRTKIEDLERRNDLEREETALRIRQEEEEENRKKKKEGHEETTNTPTGTDEYRRAVEKYITSRPLNEEEHRALSVGTATEGGYLLGEQLSDKLIENVADATFFRSLADVLPPLIESESLGVPTLTAISDGVWTSELGTPSRDTTMAFGKRALRPHPLAKEIPVSKVLVRKVRNAPTLVMRQLARAVAYANENAFLNGHGAQQPLGIYTASDDGISTSRDVSTGNTTTSPTFDGLIAAKYEIKQNYWGQLVWIFHRDVMEEIAKLKDGEGQYILRPNVVNDEPDRMLGFPVRLSEWSPSTLTTGLYVGCLGDFKSGYWIVDGLNIEVQNCEELLARSNQNLYIVRMETDGAPVLEECFARVKLG